MIECSSLVCELLSTYFAGFILGSMSTYLALKQHLTLD